MALRLLTLLLLLVSTTSALAQSRVLEKQGDGDDFFAVELTEPSIARITHDGASNFAVFAYPAEGRRDLLVNEIGAYSGTRPLGWLELPIVDIEVQADGIWTFTVLPLSEAPHPGTSIEGSGDAVLNFNDVDGRALRVSHDGSSNFAVLAYGDRRSVMINEIGTYSGRVRLVPGTLFVEIQADGRWSLEVE